MGTHFYEGSKCVWNMSTDVYYNFWSYGFKFSGLCSLIKMTIYSGTVNTKHIALTSNSCETKLDYIFGNRLIIVAVVQNIKHILTAKFQWKMAVSIYKPSKTVFITSLLFIWIAVKK